MTVLGSRDQYCVYDEVKQAKVSRTEACVSVVNGKKITQNGTISQKKVGGCNCPFRAQMMDLKDPDQQQKGKKAKRANLKLFRVQFAPPIANAERKLSASKIRV